MKTIGELMVNCKYIRTGGETYLKLDETYHLVIKLDMQQGTTWYGDAEPFNPNEFVRVIENL